MPKTSMFSRLKSKTNPPARKGKRRVRAIVGYGWKRSGPKVKNFPSLEISGEGLALMNKVYESTKRCSIYVLPNRGKKKTPGQPSSLVFCPYWVEVKK